MIHRSFDLDLLLRLTNIPAIKATPEDFKLWYDMPRNLMFADGENIGLATYEYSGLYTLHWYYTVRGRKAIDLAKAMIKNLFENYDAKVVRGLIREDLKASRWAARQVGWKSHGMLIYPDGERNELFCITKDEFLSTLEKEDK